MKNIYAAFVKAQLHFQPALKSSTNPHFKSKYAGLPEVVDAVIDALNANGIGLVQKTHPDETGVTVETVLVHESGESMDCGKLHVPAAKHDPQGYGSALTYARRYSLMAACGIAPEDDDGNAAVKAGHDDLVPALAASIEQAKQKRQGVMGAVLADLDLDTPTKVALEKLSVRVSAFAPTDAYDVIEEQGLNSDEKLYLWSLLDSKLRSALKRERTTRSLSQAKEIA
jgi:hypothetical protein